MKLTRLMFHFIHVLNKGGWRFPALTQGQCYLFSYNILKWVLSFVLHEQISAGSSKSCELLLSAVSYNVCSINLLLCNLKLRHNSREWQKSWARAPSVTGLPWPPWWLPPTVSGLLLPKCLGSYPVLQDSLPDTVLGTALFLTQNSNTLNTEAQV